MAKVTLGQTLYKVVFTEYERGWGAKPWDTEYYDNETEARNRAIAYNRLHNNLASAPNWYVRAEYVGPV